MSKSTKTIKAPLTEGFLLSDIRPHTAPAFGKLRAHSLKATKSVLALLSAAFLLSSFLPGFSSGVRSVLAQSNSQGRRISADLAEAVSNSPSGVVRVIVDTKSSSNSAAYSRLMVRISTMGGIVMRSLNSGKTAAVEIPASAISAFADDNAVKYISLDRNTQVTGHVETTTGASLVRNYGTATTGTIDGHGIGIAVLDSGVYSAHHSFNTGRVVASVDFTGEGRTDDPYGHGTHVAAIAAGNSHVGYGTYTGVAPAAKIINVRV